MSPGVHMCFPDLLAGPPSHLLNSKLAFLYPGGFGSSKSFGFLLSFPNSSETGVCPVVLCTVVLDKESYTKLR